MLLVGLAIPLFVVLPLARYYGILDAVGLTCDAEEKAALAEFPQYGGRVAGTELPIYGDEVNFPALQEPPPGACCSLRPRKHPRSRFRRTMRRSWPSMGGRSNASPWTEKESSSTLTLRVAATASVTMSTTGAARR